MSDEAPRVAQDTYLAKDGYAEFFERNKKGIQYVDTSTKTYFISRGWTLKGPIPKGVNIEHTGLAGGSMYTAAGFKREPRYRTGGSHSKRRKR